MKTIVINTGDAVIELIVPTQTTVEFKDSQETKAEAAKKYAVKSFEEIKALPNYPSGWNPEMESLCGHEITEDEYQQCIAKDGARLEWSRGFYIFPRFIKEVEPAPAKKYRIKSNGPRYLSHGWVEPMQEFAGQELTDEEAHAVLTGKGRGGDGAELKRFGGYVYRAQDIEEIPEPAPVEATTTRYFVKSLEEIKALDPDERNWNDVMAVFCGRELTKEEYQSIVEEQGKSFPWSDHWFIWPQHVNIVDPVEQPKSTTTKYFIKSLEEIEADGYPNWSLPMEKFCGREITAAEYQEIMNSTHTSRGSWRYFWFPWSDHWVIDERHIKVVTEEVKPEEPKVYRVKTLEELIAEGWRNDDVLVNPVYELCNILSYERAVLGQHISKKQWDEAQEAKSTRVYGYSIPKNALTDKPSAPVVFKELNEDHKILTYDFMLHLPYISLDSDGDLEYKHQCEYFVTELKKSGGTLLTAEQKKELLIRGETTVGLDGQNWTIYRWATTMARYEELRVVKYNELKNRPDVIVKLEGTCDEYLLHRDRTVDGAFHNDYKAASDYVLTEENFKEMLRKGYYVHHVNEKVGTCTLVPWKLEMAN